METAALQGFMEMFINRRDDYAVQLPTGQYARMGCPVTERTIQEHLAGKVTIGTYVLDTYSNCRFALFDADGVDGLSTLQQVQQTLARDGIASYLELSRRGGHLWVFLVVPRPGWLVRQWLLPYCPKEVEFFPKQDRVANYGSLVRVPLGVHRVARGRYPFVMVMGGHLAAVSTRVEETVTWLETAVVRVNAPEVQTVARGIAVSSRQSRFQREIPNREGGGRGQYPTTRNPDRYATIGDWCAAQDPFKLIGRYVDLDRRGMGCCPFGEHHSDGKDTHPSFGVYQPSRPGGYCWQCFTGQIGGNVFNFLQRLYGLDASTLWQRLQAGGVF